MARFPIAEPVALDYNLDGVLVFERKFKREVVDLVGDKNFQSAELDVSGARLGGCDVAHARNVPHRDSSRCRAERKTG